MTTLSRLCALLASAASMSGVMRCSSVLLTSAPAPNKHCTTACTLCHKIGYRGGQLGPDLTSIGRIRSERDLLEAVLVGEERRETAPLGARAENSQPHAGQPNGN